MSKLVSYQNQEAYALITIDNGKANALSHEVIDQINLCLDKAEKNQKVVVLAGKAGMFSAGYDLSVMKHSNESALELVEKGSTLSKRLLTFPTPVIAACSGHAVAKGAFLLLSADYRIGLDGEFKIGLNEVAIGMTMHQVGIELARNRLTPRYFNRSVINAEIFSPGQALEAGFLDLVVKPKKFEKTVNKVAYAMASLDIKSHRATKLKARAEHIANLEKAIELDRTSSL
ncbi:MULTISPECIES: crotonase/enoyl-CoA hydratase family protein [Alteromonadaceae]|uniref:crotonase/enoyl-CoA hydratase family protein n=1 Tax=Alteromonadaceae TaxID=72275 RepID=UPI001C0954EB|nr:MULTISPECIES: crotonase/enoyl-CoA hydratase family protein [Aliiglaciecola]MBU2879543.1 crotonase/enoyl-CoA hydratase family protein [Aliiglaciecola lipolytica]MDO6712537.1 crotonase/enoyl-CoA hydratase family protein [Aliiglaciecola sp. 2_MG-2023]MDO6753719.1 crotonase/enoyl-CoA hydratase family protein [Aliiglaciecola sp. 1_MG-2023]